MKRVSIIFTLVFITTLLFSSLKVTQTWLKKHGQIYTINELKNLKRLGLMGTNIRDLTPIKRLKNLVWLQLVLNTKVNDITPLKELKNLKVLHLVDNKISDITPLKGLKNLEVLGLNYTQVSDITPLKGLKSLKVLQLNNTLVHDLIPLKGLKNLKALDLTESKVTKEDVWALMQTLTKCKIESDYDFK